MNKLEYQKKRDQEREAKIKALNNQRAAFIRARINDPVIVEHYLESTSFGKGEK